MRIDSLDDVIKFQAEMAKVLAERLQPPKHPKEAIERLLADTRVRYKEAKAALDAVQKSREGTLRRLDMQVERHEQTLTRLKRQLDELEQRERQPDRPEPPKPRRAGRRREE